MIATAEHLLRFVEANRLIKVAEVDNRVKDVAFWTAIRRCIDALRAEPDKRIA